MPSFKVKELMIDVFPAGGPDRECALVSHCIAVTFVDCGLTVGRLTPLGCDCSRCTFDSGATCPSVSCRSPARQLDFLAALKSDLRLSLSRLEAQERALEEELRPRTLADATELEHLLASALEDVRAQKAELKDSGDEEAPRRSE